MMRKPLAAILLVLLLARICEASCNVSAPLNMILGTGQSVANGNVATPVQDPAPGAFTQALMFNGGVRFGPTCSVNGTNTALLTSFEPLAENEYLCATDHLETIGAGLTYSLQSLVSGGYQVLFVESGQDGAPYINIKQGTNAYNAGTGAATRAVAIASPQKVVVRAVTLTHGESDTQNGTTASQYETDLVTFQSNYNSDIQAITGQSQNLIMFLDQENSWTINGGGDICCPTVSLGQTQTAIDHPTTHVMVTPKYQFTYHDGLHLSGASQEYLGEYYAKAYNAVVVNGGSWTPVQPTAVSISSNVITATFSVPVSPLVLDTSVVSDPGNVSGTCTAAGSNCRGFEYTDNSSPPTISATPTVSGNQVTITLSGTPTATAGNRHLRYAYTGTIGNSAGPTTGARGCLHDSDTATSRLDGSHLYNYAVAFDFAF